MHVCINLDCDFKDRKKSYIYIAYETCIRVIAWSKRVINCGEWWNVTSNNNNNIFLKPVKSRQ